MTCFNTPNDDQGVPLQGEARPAADYHDPERLKAWNAAAGPELDAAPLPASVVEQVRAALLAAHANLAGVAPMTAEKCSRAVVAIDASLRERLSQGGQR